MISIVRIRFDTNPNSSSVWSDDQFHHWMQVLRPYSLGNFWWLSGRGLFDLEYTLYPPIVMSDPRPAAPANPREALVGAAIDAATRQVNPDWAHTDILMLWFAQKTDYFGGGTAIVHFGLGGVLAKEISVTVVDTETPFDGVCQELGHSFGLQHEVDAEGNDYRSPYSVMSARAETGRFLRPADPELPDGAAVTDPKESFVGQPSQHIVGPVLAAAQLYREARFRESPSVIRLSAGYGNCPVRLRLYALNYRVTEPPGPLPVLVSLPSHTGDGRIFTVEMRRGGYLYDAAIGTARQGAAGLVVHSINPDGRIRYEGIAPLKLASEMTDWPCSAGDFSLRLLFVDPNQEFTDVAVLGGAQKYFPIRGVLLAGKFRSQRQLNAMTHDDMRNTLIVELTKHSNQTDYQAYDNDTLAGMGAALVFLRETRIRDDAALKTMSADDQRNTVIVEIGAQTGEGPELQRLSTLELVLVALGSDHATHGQSPGITSSYIRGVLLAGHFRNQWELNRMSLEDQRNTLIVELAHHSNQSNGQALDHATLEGIGAVMVALREAGIRSDAELRAMSSDDQRNTLIVELDLQTKRGGQLQGFSNLDLVRAMLGVERP